MNFRSSKSEGNMRAKGDLCASRDKSGREIVLLSVCFYVNLRTIWRKEKQREVWFDVFFYAGNVAENRNDAKSGNSKMTHN